MLYIIEYEKWLDSQYCRPIIKNWHNLNLTQTLWYRLIYTVYTCVGIHACTNALYFVRMQKFMKFHVSSLLHTALLCALIQLYTHSILDMHHISKSQVYVIQFDIMIYFWIQIFASASLIYLKLSSIVISMLYCKYFWITRLDKKKSNTLACVHSYSD